MAPQDVDNQPSIPKATDGPSPEPDPPTPSQATAITPARRVELPAMTASGISGLTVDRGSSGVFDVYAATQVGLQHAKDGQTREDAYAVGGLPSRGWVFLAVADGLGSAEKSHAAAHLAARTAVELMHAHVPALVPATVRTEWMTLSAAITAQVASALDGAEVDEYARLVNYEPSIPPETKRSPPACTLVFAALGPVSQRGYPLLWGAVGDSELLLIDLESGQQNWVTHNPTKQRGGMMSNATAALPKDHRDVKAGYQLAAVNDMTVLASDGMAEAIRLVPEQFATLLPQVAGPRPAEWMFGEVVSFDLPGLHDDRTIIAAWPRRSTPAQNHLRPNKSD